MYIPSNKIKIYPTAYRGKDASGNVFDPASRFVTESNSIRPYLALARNGGSFVITKDSEWASADHIEFVVHGYYFNVAKDAIGTMSPVYVNLCVEKIDVAGTKIATERLSSFVATDSAIDVLNTPDNSSECHAVVFSQDSTTPVVPDSQKYVVYQLYLLDSNGHIPHDSTAKFNTEDVLDGVGFNLSERLTTEKVIADEIQSKNGASVTIGTDLDDDHKAVVDVTSNAVYLRSKGLVVEESGQVNSNVIVNTAGIDLNSHDGIVNINGDQTNIVGTTEVNIQGATTKISSTETSLDSEVIKIIDDDDTTSHQLQIQSNVQVGESVVDPNGSYLSADAAGLWTLKAFQGHTVVSETEPVNPENGTLWLQPENVDIPLSKEILVKDTTDGNKLKSLGQIQPNLYYDSDDSGFLYWEYIVSGRTTYIYLSRQVYSGSWDRGVWVFKVTTTPGEALEYVKGVWAARSSSDTPWSQTKYWWKRGNDIYANDAQGNVYKVNYTSYKTDPSKWALLQIKNSVASGEQCINTAAVALSVLPSSSNNYYKLPEDTYSAEKPPKLYAWGSSSYFRMWTTLKPRYLLTGETLSASNVVLSEDAQLSGSIPGYSNSSWYIARIGGGTSTALGFKVFATNSGASGVYALTWNLTAGSGEVQVNKLSVNESYSFDNSFNYCHGSYIYAPLFYNLYNGNSGQPANSSYMVIGNSSITTLSKESITYWNSAKDTPAYFQGGSVWYADFGNTADHHSYRTIVPPAYPPINSDVLLVAAGFNSGDNVLYWEEYFLRVVDANTLQTTGADFTTIGLPSTPTTQIGRYNTFTLPVKNSSGETSYWATFCVINSRLYRLTLNVSSHVIGIYKVTDDFAMWNRPNNIYAGADFDDGSLLMVNDQGYFKVSCVDYGGRGLFVTVDRPIDVAHTITTSEIGVDVINSFTDKIGNTYVTSIVNGDLEYQWYDLVGKVGNYSRTYFLLSKNLVTRNWPAIPENSVLMTPKDLPDIEKLFGSEFVVVPKQAPAGTFNEFNHSTDAWITRSLFSLNTDSDLPIVDLARSNQFSSGNSSSWESKGWALQFTQSSGVQPRFFCAMPSSDISSASISTTGVVYRSYKIHEITKNEAGELSTDILTPLQTKQQFIDTAWPGFLEVRLLGTDKLVNLMPIKFGSRVLWISNNYRSTSNFKLVEITSETKETQRRLKNQGVYYNGHWYKLDQ